MYQFHHNDVQTLDKLNERSRPLSLHSAEDLKESGEASLHKTRQSRHSAKAVDGDLNPKLSHQEDTPASGVKILKPSRMGFGGSNTSSNSPRRRPGNYASEKEGEEKNSKKAATYGSVNEDSLKICKSIFPEAEASEPKKKQEWSAPLEGRAAEAYDSRVRGRSIEERAERLEKAAKKLGKAEEGEKDRDQLRRSSIKRIEELCSRKEDKQMLGQRKDGEELRGRSASSKRDKNGEEKVFYQGDFKTGLVLNEVSAVGSAKVNELLMWVQEQGFLRYYTDISTELPDECKNGAFLFNLINKLERLPLLKGLNLHNKTGVRVNYDKIFSHLKKKEKFNPRFFGGEYYLASGHKDVFWGLIDDILHCYQRRISSQDRRFNRRAPQTTAVSPNPESRSIFNLSLSPRPSRPTEPQLAKEAIRKESRDTKKRSLSRHSLAPVSEPKQSITAKAKDGNGRRRLEVAWEKERGGEQRLRLRSGHQQVEMSPRGNGLVAETRNQRRPRFVDLQGTPLNARPQRLDLLSLAELEKECRAWLDCLGIRVPVTDCLFGNPLRNGYLLAYLTATIFHSTMNPVCKEPKTVNECRQNIETALQSLRAADLPIPYELLWNVDGILKGTPSVVWPLISSLKYVFQNGAPQATSMSQAANLSSINTSGVLPYSESQIAALSESLRCWLVAIGVHNEDQCLPLDFEDLLVPMSKGTLLSRIIFKLDGTVLTGLHSRPLSRPNCLHNLRKCFDHLQRLKRMSRRFIWRVEDIADCKRLQTIGLLEDLNRYYDGLPRRTDPNYFHDGPYTPSKYAEASQRAQQQRRGGEQAHDDLNETRLRYFRSKSRSTDSRDDVMPV